MATALETKLLAAVAELPDGIAQEDAKELVAIIVAARAAAATASSNDVISYSVAGRSVTRRVNSDFWAYVRSLESDLMEILQGSVSLIDMSNTEAT